MRLSALIVLLASSTALATSLPVTKGDTVRANGVVTSSLSMLSAREASPVEAVVECTTGN